MKYLEFKVKYHNGEIVSKVPTERKSVAIKELTARTNNLYTKQTGLLYELEEVEKPKAVPKKK
jgi:hypothetical protein